jgi:HlyD family secretion protein
LVAIALATTLLAILWWQAPRVHYLTAPARRVDILTEVTASGTANAVVTTEVSSQLSGQVAGLLADFNDRVKEGQPLARLDARSFEASLSEAEAELEMGEATLLTRDAAVERAQADLANARALRAAAEGDAGHARAKHEEARNELKRLQVLSQRGTISDSQLDQARTQDESTEALLRAAEAQLDVRDAAIRSAKAALRMANAEASYARAEVRHKRARLEKARVDLDRTEIRAPIEGVVIRRSVELGQTVAASLQAPTLFSIAQDLREMQVEVKVDEADIGQIRIDQPATFTVDAHPGRVFEGRVQQIRKAPEVVQNVVTYTVIVSAANPDLVLFPGMTAIVRIVVAETTGTLAVPNAALRFTPNGTDPASVPDGPTLWVLDPAGKPVPIPVTTSTADTLHTAITSGPLQPGDPVIIGEDIQEGRRLMGRLLRLSDPTQASGGQ